MNKCIIGLILSGLICVGGGITESYANESLTEKAQVKTEQTRTQNGWVKTGYDNWIYYKDGEMLKGKWLKDNGKWYYFDDYGYMAYAESYFIDGKHYVFDNSGAMIEKKGWIYVENIDGYDTWYWGNGDGTVKTEQWIKDNGKWYYVDYDGRLITSDSYEIGNKVYLFDANGSMINKKGWIYLESQGPGPEGYGYWYWGNGDGTVKTEQWMKDNGKWYYFNDHGSMADDICEIGNKSYLFDVNGAMIEKKGWIYVENKYFGNYWCWGNGDGTVKTEQWIKDNGKWYYLNSWGELVSDGINWVGNKIYLFDSNGAIIEKKGWISLKDYYGNTEWYWGNGDGTVLKDQSFEIDGKEYIFNSNGVCINPY